MFRRAVSHLVHLLPQLGTHAAVQARGALALGLALVAFAAAGPAAGQGVDIGKRRGTFTPGELALLPEFCRDIQGTPTYWGERGDHWRALMGDDFKHMHHYCRGLRDARYAVGPGLTARDRAFLWARASNEYHYIISHSQPTMVLLPEVFLKLGEAQLELGHIYDAQVALERARALRPDYWPAYVRWADVLIDLKKFDSARSLLYEGLRFSPDSPELLERYRQVAPDGDLPPPAPVAAASAPPAEAAASAATAASAPASEATDGRP